MSNWRAHFFHFLFTLLLGSSLNGSVNAYIAINNSLEVYDTATDTFITSIPLTYTPIMTAISPDGKKIFLANFSDRSVSVVDTEINAEVAIIPTGMGSNPLYLAITPDGSRVFVVDFGTNSVRVIDASSHALIGAPIPVGMAPQMIAINHAGTKAYVPNYLSTSVSIIDTQTPALITNVTTMNRPIHVAITPDDGKIFVANYFGSTVSVISGPGNNILVMAIMVDLNPQFIAIAKNGTREAAYVANYDGSTVTAIDTTTYATTTLPLPAMSFPFYISVTPDQNKAYVANQGGNNISVIDTVANSILGGAIAVGNFPSQLAITPNGGKVYVTNSSSPFASIILTANDVTAPQIGLPFSPIWIVIGPPEGNFLDLSGFQILNRFLTQTSRVNVIEWPSSPESSGVAQYLIYRDAARTQFVGSVLSTQGTIRFLDPNVLANIPYTYYIFAQDINGSLSEPNSITISPQ